MLAQGRVLALVFALDERKAEAWLNEYCMSRTQFVSPSTVMDTWVKDDSDKCSILPKVEHFSTTGD